MYCRMLIIQSDGRPLIRTLKLILILQSVMNTLACVDMYSTMLWYTTGYFFLDANFPNGEPLTLAKTLAEMLPI